MGLRIIKFRGKSIYGEDWMYGSLVKLEKDRYSVIPPLNDIEVGKSIGMYEVHPETVCQFTGLLDKNGKEIYEGDIISVNGKYPKLVKYIDDYACFCLANITDLNKKWISPWQQVFPSWWNDFKREIRVIGNIYDNPDLIKEE